MVGYHSVQIGIREKGTTFRVKIDGRYIQRHLQAHRLQLLSVEVEHEGHVGGQGSLIVSAVRRWKTRQDKCTDLGGDAFEDDGIHSMLHQHEPVQQIQ